MLETSRLIHEAIGKERKLVAFNKGCSVEYLKRQFEPDYKNWIDKTDEWLDAFTHPSLKAGFELIRNYFDLGLRRRWRKICGIVETFPSPQIERLVLIQRLTDELLTA